jgi:hypothetical protein
MIFMIQHAHRMHNLNMTIALRAGALRELCVTLVRVKEVVCREARSVYATAGGTAAAPGVVASAVDVE